MSRLAGTLNRFTSMRERRGRIASRRVLDQLPTPAQIGATGAGGSMSTRPCAPGAGVLALAPRTGSPGFNPALADGDARRSASAEHLVLALTASFAGRRTRAINPGTLSSHTGSLVGWMIDGVVIVDGLEHLPASALGPSPIACCSCLGGSPGGQYPLGQNHCGTV